MDRVLATACAQHTGEYRLSDSLEVVSARADTLGCFRRLEADIAEMRAKIRRETQFNRQVELNATLKTLEHQLHNLTNAL